MLIIIEIIIIIVKVIIGLAAKIRAGILGYCISSWKDVQLALSFGLLSFAGLQAFFLQGDGARLAVHLLVQAASITDRFTGGGASPQGCGGCAAILADGTFQFRGGGNSCLGRLNDRPVNAV